MDFQPSTSSMDPKGKKRKADQSNTQDPISRSDSANSSPKRSKNENEDNEDNKCKEYNAGGLKFSFHGVVFQVKLLMLFIHRAIKLKYKFRLATDMNMAEKFDDVVFEYEPSDPNKRKFIFVQAKHKNECENKNITITDLKSEAGDFSLQKYFNSFCKMIKQTHFQNVESNKYLIVTNTDFNFMENYTQTPKELIKEWRQYIKLGDNELPNYKILYFHHHDFEAKVYKLYDNEGGLKKMMKQNLLNSALKTKKLKEFKSISAYFHLVLKLGFIRDFEKSNKKFKDLKIDKETNKEQNKQNGKKIILTKDELEKMAIDAMKLYKNVFAEKVTLNDIEKKAKETIELLNEKKAGKLKSNEFESKLLKRYEDKFVGESEKNRIIDIVLMETGVLLESVEDELDRVKKESEKMENSNENDGLKGEKEKFKEYVNELKAKTINSSDSKEAKTHSENVGEASVIEAALDNAKFEENLNGFIEHFRIVTNYPGESKLGGLIKEELGVKFNLLDADLAYAEFEREAFNFLRVYKDGKANYKNQDDALKDFENIVTGIAGLMISGYGRSYPQKLRQYGIKFKKTKKELDDFLKSENETKIFQLITQSTRLGAIKVLQSVDAIDEYKKSDSLIFMRLRTLLRDETRQQILNSFQSNNSTNSGGSGKPNVLRNTYNLIVVEIQNKDQKTIKDQIEILNGLLYDIPCRKIIVIDSVERSYKCGSESKEEEIKFEDFDENSQDKILEREVNFQGNNIQLNRLIDIDLAGKVLDHLILSRIIENEQISIGDQKKAFSSIGYVEDCYIERKFCRPIISKKIIIEKSDIMKLFITGVDKEDLINFGGKSDDIEEIKLIDIKQYEDCDFKKYTGKSIIIPPSVRNHKFYNSECENVFNNVHWLQRVFTKIFHELGDNVHWLHYTQSRFFWMNSKNDSTELIEFVQTDTCENTSVGNATLDEIHFAKTKISDAIDTNDMIFTRLATQVRHLQTFEIKIESTNQHGFMRPDLNYYANNSNLILKLPDEYVQLCLQDFDEGDKAKAKGFLERLATLCDPNHLIAKIEGSVRRTIIVANDAGMGKSTVLTSLARKMRQLDYKNKEPTNYRWIVRINLNDFADEKHETCLDRILLDQDNKINTAKAIEFVTKMAIPGDPKNDLIVRLQRKIFKLSLKKSRKEKKTPNIVLMFDGFDEIAPSYREKTTTLIKELQASQVAQIWISTRVHELLDLQKNLNSLGFVMAPLSHQNQIEFTNNFWKWKLKFKPNQSNNDICERDTQDILKLLNGRMKNLPDEEYADQLNKCITQIVENFAQSDRQIELEELRKAIDQLDFSKFFEGMIGHWKESIKDYDNRFTINPLQLKMLTEVVFAGNFELPKDFGLSNLYNKFIEMKFDIYFEEKEKRIKGNVGAGETGEDTLELSYKVHEAIAVSHFFHEICEEKYSLPNLDVLNRFKLNGQGREEKEKLKYARRGILVLNGDRLEFIHPSFAEFFLSNYLIENAEDERVHDLLFPQILVDDNYKLVREFFNKKLEETDTYIELGKTSMNLINKHLENIEGSFLSLIENGQNKILELLLAASFKMTEGIIEKHILNFDNISKLIRLGRNDEIETIFRFVKQNEKYMRDGSFDDCITKTCAFLKKEPDGNKYTGTIENSKNAIRNIFGTNRFEKLFPSVNEYKASGLKLNFHGVEFQVKLFMLFIHRAIQLKYEFRPGTDMVIAEKFDGVVLEFSKPNEPHKRNFILVQAQHRIDREKSKITITNLKSEYGCFSLQEYFISFCKIIRNAHFQDAESSKYFIITNTDIDFIGNEPQKSNGLIDKWRHFIQWEGNLRDDEILGFRTSDFKAEVYKLCDNTDELKKIIKLNLSENVLKTKKIKDFKSVSAYLDLIAKQTHFPDLDRLSAKLKYLQKENERRIVNKDEITKMAKEASELYEVIFAGKVTQDRNENKANEINYFLKGKKASELTNIGLEDIKKNVLDFYTDIFVGESAKMKLEKKANELIEFLKEKGEEKITKRELVDMVNEALELNKDLDGAKNKLMKRKHDKTVPMEIQKKNVLRETNDLLKIVKDECDRLENELQKFENKISNEYKRLKEDKQSLEEYEHKLKETNPSDLDKAKLLVVEIVLDNAKFEEHFDEFIKHFRIVTNYPTHLELGALIGDELKDVFNLMNADLAYAAFERNALNMLKEYHKGKANFYTQKDALDFFNKIEREIASLMTSGLGKSYLKANNKESNSIKQ